MTVQDWNQLKDLGHYNHTNEHRVDLLSKRIKVFCFLKILKGPNINIVIKTSWVITYYVSKGILKLLEILGLIVKIYNFMGCL